MKYVLDTNVVSALMRGEASVVERLSRVAIDTVSIPEPALAEIEYGIERLARSRRKEFLRRRAQLVCGELARAPWTAAVTRSFGTVKAQLERRGERIEDFDIAIAAHALAIDAVLVTANVGQLTRVPGLSVEDWSTPARPQ